MIGAWLSGVALAAPSVESGWAAFRAGDFVGAEAIAAERLGIDPGEIGAGRLHLRARARLDGDAAAIAEARSAVEAAPALPAHRLLLADALLEAWRFEPSWCAEIAALVGATPARADHRFWTHALRWRATSRRCPDIPGAPELDRDAALALADPVAVPGSDAASINLLLAGGVDDRDAKQILALLRQEPALLGRLEEAWELPEGRAVARVRKVAVEHARAVVPHPSVHGLTGALAILDAAGDPAWARADAALRQIDPEAHGRGVERDIARARGHVDPERSLEHVVALGPKLPTDARSRAMWESARADLLWELGREAEALEAYRAAWQASPDDGDRANAFAYRAVAGAAAPEVLQDALAAATIAVEAARAKRFADRPWAGETWAGWRERTTAEVGGALDTRGWVLHALGRDEQAVGDLLQAARTIDVPVVHLHAGLVLAALGEGEDAAHHLARGVAERDPREAAAVQAGWAALESWWAGSGRWHARGVRGWVADVLHTEVPAPRVREDNALVGRTLPAVVVRSGDRELNLAEIEGPAVVDFWATWCRPCIESLPKVAELTRSHEGVRFLAVSVDSERSAVDAFFEGSPPPYEVAWWSADQSPYEALGMAGVPSLFVIGRDGAVASYLLGSELNRLGEAVEAVVDTPLAAPAGHSVVPRPVAPVELRRSPDGAAE